MQPVDETTRTMIVEQLDRVERECGVRVLYACESGSRAWGFPSRDSDYDVRFIYAHPLPYYISIAEKRDVIEQPIEDNFDLSGWDIRKALDLFRRSNPPLLEWLQSPIVYRERSDLAKRLKTLLPRYYSPKNCLFHYVHMAQGNVRDYLKGERVWTKKYFYVLRPLLACRWIERTSDVVPMEFDRLVEACAPRGEFYDSVQTLLRRKLSGDEMDEGPRVLVFHDFIDKELARFESLAVTAEVSPERHTAALDDLIWNTLHTNCA